MDKICLIVLLGWIIAAVSAVDLQNHEVQELVVLKMSGGKEQFTFFYRKESPFSQFHPCSFEGVSLFPSSGKKDQHPTDTSVSKNCSVRFNSCEQWMMYNKAMLFGDIKIAESIIKTKSPLQCKQLGRKVKNFDVKEWKKHNRCIIYEGNRLKFTQNPGLLQSLRETVGTTLVEASPRDTIYGIGLSASDPRAQSRKTWRGQNLLGEVLTELRENIL